MSQDLERRGWLPDFRRAVRYIWPHKRPLLLGLLAAVGVSVFYTSGISSIIPALKIIFADHETLVDWLHRTEAQRRLDVVLPGDVPDAPEGLTVSATRPGSPNAEQLSAGDQITAVGGERVSAFEATARLATVRDDTVTVTVEDRDGGTAERTVALAPYRAWWGTLRDAAQLLPQGDSPEARFLTLAGLMSIVVLITVLGSLCRFANEGLVAVAVQRALHDLRCHLADQVLRLPIPWHTTHATGDTLGRFATDLNRVETGVWTLFGKTVREPLKAVGVLALTLAIDWRILVVAGIGLPIGALIIRTFGRLVKRGQRRASKSWGLLLDHLDERLAGIRVVKAYNMEAAEGRRFRGEAEALRKAQTHIEVADAATKPTLETLAIIAVAAFIMYGGYRVFANDIEPYVFFGAVICLAGTFDPVRKLGNVNNRVQAADAAASRVFELIDTPPEPLGTEAVEAPARFEQALTLHGLSFAYPNAPEQLVVDQMDLTIEKGDVVALVGPNGSGKTTLISLLLRFFEPTAGRIMLDGQDLAEWPLATLRRLFGLVPQDAVIFSGTVAENIAYGVEQADEAAIEAAARHAHLDEFLEELQRTDAAGLTRGLATQINAKSLSGGQKQRLALARAILRDPPILILDEATSQVDAESEAKIQAALAEVTQDRTVIIIAHRLSTIRHADRIVVLDRGQIVGSGSHPELIETCPTYAALAQTQLIADG